MPFVITISRQLGSGGAYLGRQLAEKLNILYADREIINLAAKKLSLLQDDFESRNEKILSIWQSFLEFSAFAKDVYIPPKTMLPMDIQLFKVESEIIKHIAKELSAVIIGRCGSYILREYQNHISIFLHSDISSRRSRIQELYNMSEQDAGKVIEQNDKEKTLYHYNFTGMEWTDIRQYDLSIDTSKIGLDKSLELVLNYLELTKHANTSDLIC